MNNKENAMPSQPLNEALPNPEPAAPSLSEPDPGVYHHTPAKLPEENEE